MVSWLGSVVDNVAGLVGLLGDVNTNIASLLEDVTSSLRGVNNGSIGGDRQGGRGGADSGGGGSKHWGKSRLVVVVVLGGEELVCFEVTNSCPLYRFLEFLGYALMCLLPSIRYCHILGT